MNTNNIVTPYKISIQVISTRALRCTHTTVKESSPKLETERSYLYNAGFLYIRTTLDFVPWPDQVPRHHPPHRPEKIREPWRNNARCVKLFETADRIQYLKCAVKVYTSTYSNLQKSVHSIPTRSYNNIHYNFINNCFI